MNGFSEKDFYLAEFRGRTLAIALSEARAGDLESLESVLAELEANTTRVVLLSPNPALLEGLTGESPLVASDSRLVGRLWRVLRQQMRVGIAVAPDDEFARVCCEIVLRLRLAKLVWIDPDGRGLAGASGERLSFINLAELDLLLEAERKKRSRATPRACLLQELREVVAGGIASVNFCGLAGLADELFTYAGSGTFLARDRYVDVRWLALDEYDAAHHLIQRGVAEGYLVARSEGVLEEVLAHAFGVFIEGRHMAGIGALLIHLEDRAGEIASLYTLTRFLGEGVGGHLVDFAIESGCASRLTYLFACTTSERVERFFERCGFRRVDRSQLPAAKWKDYPPERLERVRCMRRELR
jgi:N-acetylglutamate synthase-like GNAT family acetyltransferase